MANIDKIALVHPIRLESIRKGKTRSCESCQHSQYQSGTQERAMEFKGCDAIQDVMSEPMCCSKFSMSDDLLDDQERIYYEEKGICWD